MIWATWLVTCFCWLYRDSPSLAAKKNLISVLTIWWCPCVELSLALLEEGVYYDQVSWQSSAFLFPTSFCTPRPNLPVTPSHFWFGSASSFFMELFLHSSLVAYWSPTDLGISSFSVISFWLFILFMGFSRQEYSPRNPLIHFLSVYIFSSGYFIKWNCTICNLYYQTFSVSMILLMFIHIVTHIRSSVFSIAEKYFIGCITHIGIFINLLMDIWVVLTFWPPWTLQLWTCYITGHVTWMIEWLNLCSYSLM